MKTYTITEAQLQELAGRLNALTLQGLANHQHIGGILVVLDSVGKTEQTPEASNVVDIKDAG